MDLKEEANRIKQQGNEFFKQKKYLDAIQYYTKSLDLDKNSAVYSNRALCYIKNEEYENAENDCILSLQIDNTFAKSWLRLAICKMHDEKYKEAYVYLLKCELYVQNTPDVKNRKQECKMMDTTCATLTLESYIKEKRNSIDHLKQLRQYEECIQECERLLVLITDSNQRNQLNNFIKEVTLLKNNNKKDETISEIVQEPKIKTNKINKQNNERIEKALQLLLDKKKQQPLPCVPNKLFKLSMDIQSLETDSERLFEYLYRVIILYNVYLYSIPRNVYVQLFTNNNDTEAFSMLIKAFYSIHKHENSLFFIDVLVDITKSNNIQFMITMTQSSVMNKMTNDEVYFYIIQCLSGLASIISGFSAILAIVEEKLNGFLRQWVYRGILEFACGSIMYILSCEIPFHLSLSTFLFTYFSLFLTILGITNIILGIIFRKRIQFFYTISRSPSTTMIFSNLYYKEAQLLLSSTNDIIDRL
ncbi:hypothetical protein WA158_004656 [Blastocystis sp. Blastoise]